MNHNAAELFPGWYAKGLNKEVSPEEITLRRKAMAEIIKSNDKTLWIKILKVYIGVSKYGSPEYSEVVDLIKKGDDNFSIQNENLVKLLSGSTLAHKIDENKSYLADLLTMGVLTSKILPLETDVIPELRNKVTEFWIRDSESQRNLNLQLNTGSGVLKNSSKIELTEFTPEAVTKAFTSLQKELNAANADINILSNTLKEVKRNFIALSEETNILWWLFGSYSSIVKRPFNRLSIELLGIVSALELSKMSSLPSAIGGIEGLINRAISNVPSEPGATHSIASIVESIKENEEAIKSFVPAEHSNLSILTSCVTALKCRLEFSGAEWKAVFKKQSILDLENKYSVERFALQLYQELTLIKLYEKLQ